MQFAYPSNSLKKYVKSIYLNPKDIYNDHRSNKIIVIGLFVIFSVI